MNKKIVSNESLLLVFLLVAILYRIYTASDSSILPNFSPIGAIALFGGAYFSKTWMKFAFPLVLMLISEVLINSLIFKGQYGILHDTWYFTYGILVIIVFIGQKLLTKITVGRVLLASVAASLTYWLLMDATYLFSSQAINVVTNQPLTKDLNGLITAYIQGLPFAKNFMVGTLVFSGILFGGYEFATKKTFAFN